MLTTPTPDRLKGLRLAAFVTASQAQRQDPAVATLGFDERLGFLVEAECRAAGGWRARGCSHSNVAEWDVQSPFPANRDYGLELSYRRVLRSRGPSRLAPVPATPTVPEPTRTKIFLDDFDRAGS
jgi:hypothetical protein